MKKFLSVTIMVMIVLCGCGKGSPPREKEPGIVEYATGAEQIKTYRKAKARAEEINKILEERSEGVEY
jgi:hypothetical protein